MAAQPDISAILAALSAAQQQKTPAQQAQPPPAYPQPSAGVSAGFPLGFPGAVATPTPPQPLPGYGLPAPVSSGSIDLSNIRPVNSGSVNVSDPRKGGGYGSNTPRDDYRGAGRRRSRSRSPRRDGYRDSYSSSNNPYREDRRDYGRSDGYGRDRSRSPPRRGGRFSPAPGASYRRERSPAGDGNEIIIIDAALVGLVIGRQGENLKRIEQTTGTKIQFMTKAGDGGPRRECRITGTAQQRFEAKREINRIIEENGGNPPQETGGFQGKRPLSSSGVPSLREGENSVQIMVPDRTVGLIIGRGGETIRDLQERSGCHVNIVGENKSVNGLRPVNLIGTPEAAQKAKDLIMEIVESDTRGQGGAPQEKAPRANVGNNFSNGNNFVDNAGKTNKKIVVPSEAVGMIIGKGGETIRDIQSSTGAKINVSPPQGIDHERDIDLVGTRQAIEAAERAIRAKVESLREKGDFRGAGRGQRDDMNGRQGGQSDTAAYNAAQTATPMNPAAGATAAADPYAAWGGYQNYAAMWYAAMANQQGGQPPAGGQYPPAGQS